MINFIVNSVQYCFLSVNMPQYSYDQRNSAKVRTIGGGTFERVFADCVAARRCLLAELKAHCAKYCNCSRMYFACTLHLCEQGSPLHLRCVSAAGLHHCNRNRGCFLDEQQAFETRRGRLARSRAARSRFPVT